MADAPLWLLAFLAFPLGYLAGRIVGAGPRRMAIALTLALPLAAWAILFASDGARKLGFAAWWFVGLVLFATPVAGWIVLGLAGYSFAKWRRRSLG